jgi:hypothetical protein
MADDPSKRLTPAEVQARADECRVMAKRALNQSHQIMLISMAETWERIAADTKRDQ